MIGCGKSPRRIHRHNKIEKILGSICLKKLAAESGLDVDHVLVKIKLVRYLKRVLKKSIAHVETENRNTITVIDILKGVEDVGLTENGFY